MSLFPILDTGASEAVRELPLYREVAWNFREGKPLFQQGEPVILTGPQALRVWIWKALLTQRARYEIYSWNFGCEVESLIGQNYTTGLKEAEAARYVREALEVNPYITAVRNIQVDFSGGTLRVSALVNTIYGEVDMDV